MITKRIKVNIPDNSKISDFEPILSPFSNWTQFKREIKLSSILEGKKIEYLIEDINSAQNPIYGLLEQSGNIVEIKKISFLIKEILFTIKDQDVLNLEVRIESINTEYGKTTQSLIDADIDFTLDYYKSFDSMIYFYINFPKQAA
jgi:hypothetical protein